MPVHDALGETRSEQSREGYLDTVAACIGDFLRAAAVAATGASAAAEMSGEEGLRDLAVVDAAVRSVMSGRLEDVFTVS